jgi:hypothetical protein
VVLLPVPSLDSVGAACAPPVGAVFLYLRIGIFARFKGSFASLCPPFFPCYYRSGFLTSVSFFSLPIPLPFPSSSLRICVFLPGCSLSRGCGYFPSLSLSCPLPISVFLLSNADYVVMDVVFHSSPLSLLLF